MVEVRHHRFKARNPLNLPKVGVAKHKVGGANLKVGGAAAPTNCIGNSAPWHGVTARVIDSRTAAGQKGEAVPPVKAEYPGTVAQTRYPSTVRRQADRADCGLRRDGGAGRGRQ